MRNIVTQTIVCNCGSCECFNYGKAENYYCCSVAIKLFVNYVRLSNFKFEITRKSVVFVNVEETGMLT